YLVAALDRRLTHGIHSMLHRLTLMSCKGFQQSVANCSPAQSEVDFSHAIQPLCLDHSRENPIARLRESGVGVSDVSIEGGSCGTQDEQIFNPGRDRAARSSSSQAGCARLAAA